MIESFDTVFAPSSAIGGAISVIRVSGGQACAIAQKLLDRPVWEQPNQMRHTRILRGGQPVDDCMAVFFKAPKSYTGEDMLELHCHGGMTTVRCVLAALSEAGGVPAGPGEFTRRAFLNGKMDLSQAEAVMDVINAQAENSLRAALEQLSGSVSRRIRESEERLLNVRAAIEAAIDYPDEAEEAACASLKTDLRAAEETVAALIEEGRKGRILRDGLKLVILGRPNVGKSSLLNALLGEDRAIVTAAAGTTRDVLDERISIGGVPVRLIDTAGVREASDEAERIGVDRAKKALETADAVLLVLDGSMPETPEDEALLSETEGKTRLVVANKSDLGTCIPDALEISTSTTPSAPGFRLAKTAPGPGRKSRQKQEPPRLAQQTDPGHPADNDLSSMHSASSPAAQPSPSECFNSFVSVSLVVHGFKRSDGRSSMLPMRPGSWRRSRI